MTSTNNNQAALLGLATVALTAATTMTAATMYSTHANTDGEILVFPDSPNGLKKNAITIKYDRIELQNLQFIMNILAKELNSNNSKGIRLFIQASKKEVKTSDDWIALLNSSSKETTNNGRKEIILISTTDGDELSEEAASLEPFQHFDYTENVRNLPVIGQKLAYSGNEALPIKNAYTNVFTVNDKIKTSKTYMINRPPPKEIANGFKDRYNIQYDPSQYGTILTVDQDFVYEMQNRQADFPKVFGSLPAEAALKSLGENGLFTSSTEDDSWTTGHDVLPKYFNAMKIKKYFPLILEKTEVFISQWVKQGSSIEDANDWLTSMTADAVVKAAMGYDMKNVERKGAGQELHPFITSFRYCVAHILGKTSPRDEKEYIRQRKISEEIVNEIVERTRKGEIGQDGLSFIKGMLDAKSSSNGEYIKYADFFGHIMNLMVAGHETTAATLGFCLVEISKNPEIREKCLKEIEEVLGDRCSPTYEDISKLTYIEACFKESLRLNPPVQRLRKEALHDSVVLGNKLIRKGQSIEVLMAGMHRDPDQFDQGVFGDPNKFNPDRHMPGAPARHPNAMTPFGYGIRGCIGSQFATLEAKTFLCMALNYFNVDTADDFKPIPHMGHGAAPTCKDLEFQLSYRRGGPLSRVDLFKE